jgi:tetrahydrodipicolinate N-succinyltransferase
MLLRTALRTKADAHETLTRREWIVSLCFSNQLPPQQNRVQKAKYRALDAHDIRTGREKGFSLCIDMQLLPQHRS